MILERLFFGLQAGEIDRLSILQSLGIGMLPALGDHLTLQFVHLAGERDFFVGDLFFQRAQLGQRLLEIRLGRAGGRLKRLRLAKRLAKQDDQKENKIFFIITPPT